MSSDFYAGALPVIVSYLSNAVAAAAMRLTDRRELIVLGAILIGVATTLVRTVYDGWSSRANVRTPSKKATLSILDNVHMLSTFVAVQVFAIGAMEAIDAAELTTSETVFFFLAMLLFFLAFAKA